MTTNQTIDGVPLVPCPFCGCQVTFLTGREDYRVAGTHSKACPFLDVDVVVDSRSAWNSRADQPAPVAAVPGGWQMVPQVPTDDMIVAFAEAWYSKHQTIDDPDMLDAYRDMLVAAPQHPNNL